MPEWFITLAPGLLVAIAPALLTLSVQAVWSVPRRRAAARADRSRIALDLIGRAHVITMLLPFTQAHAEAATKLPAQPLILLGMFPKFDLGAMGDTYSRHFAELLKSSSEARMSGNAELATLADELVAATTATFDAYINTDDTRPSIHRWYAARPPLDKDDAEQAAKRLYAATSDLERFAGASGAKFRLRRR